MDDNEVFSRCTLLSACLLRLALFEDTVLRLGPNSPFSKGTSGTMLLAHTLRGHTTSVSEHFSSVEDLDKQGRAMTSRQAWVLLTSRVPVWGSIWLAWACRQDICMWAVAAVSAWVDRVQRCVPHKAASLGAPHQPWCAQGAVSDRSQSAGERLHAPHNPPSHTCHHVIHS